jgi:hypothetical protein
MVGVKKKKKNLRDYNLLVFPRLCKWYLKKICAVMNTPPPHCVLVPPRLSNETLLDGHSDCVERWSVICHHLDLIQNVQQRSFFLLLNLTRYSLFASLFLYVLFVHFFFKHRYKSVFIFLRITSMFHKHNMLSVGSNYS